MNRWIQISEEAESWHIVKEGTEIITLCGRSGNENTRREHRPHNEKTCEVCFRLLDIPVAPV